MSPSLPSPSDSDPWPGRPSPRMRGTATAGPRPGPNTARRAPADSSPSPPGSARCGAPGRCRRCAASTLTRATARHHRPGQASPGCVSARGGPPPESAPTPAHSGPRQPGQPRHQAALRSAHPAARGVTAPAHRVGLAQPFLHQEVAEQPDRHQPLLDRGVRQPRIPSRSPPRSHRYEAAATSAPARRRRRGRGRGFAKTGSTPSRSHNSRYSASSRAYARICS
jgi:hypothetical protein